MKIFLSILVTTLVSTLSFSQEMNKVDAQGRKQGKWGKLYEGTRVFMYRGEFKNDRPIGKFTYYYKSSKVKAIIKHDEGSNRSVAYFYHEEGTLMSCGIYRDLKKDSIWVNFTPSQRLSTKETYKSDSLDGMKVVFFIPEDPNDKSQRVSAIYNYKNGAMHGESKEYFLSGVVKQKGQYTDNKRTGAWEDFHPNGKRSVLTRYKDGMKHGWAIVYDEKMKRIAETYYYYGRALTGAELKDKLKRMEEAGIDPNK